MGGAICKKRRHFLGGRQAQWRVELIFGEEQKCVQGTHLIFLRYTYSHLGGLVFCGKAAGGPLTNQQF